MRRYLQAGALFVLVVLPVLVFMFLKLFGRNHFEIPRYNPATNAAGEVIKVGKDTVFRAVTIYQMQNLKGEKVSIPADKSISIIVFSGDTCDADCQKRQKQLLRLQEMFEREQSVKLFSIRALNSGETLSNMAAKAGAIPSKWYYVQANAAYVENFKTKEIFLKNPSLLKTFEFDKSFILVDKQHYVRGFYDGTNPEDVDRLTVEIKILLDNYRE